MKKKAENRKRNKPAKLINYSQPNGLSSVWLAFISGKTKGKVIKLLWNLTKSFKLLGIRAIIRL